MDSKDAEKADDNTDVGSNIDIHVSNVDLVPNAGKIVLGMLCEVARICLENLISGSSGTSFHSS
jgi:hypothetical protein